MDIPLSTPLTLASPAVTDGEVIIIRVRPSLWFILLQRQWLGLAILSAVAYWILSAVVAPAPDMIRSIMVLVFLLLLALNILDYLCRLYTLTDRRILRSSGILRRVFIDVPLARTQTVTLTKSLPERLFGLGSIGITTAASAGDYDLTWFMVARPAQTLHTVREAIARAQRGGTS